MSQYRMQRTTLFAALMMVSHCVMAAIENQVSVGMGLESDDNVYKTDILERKDTIARVMLNADLGQKDTITDWGINYNLFHEKYLDDSFQDQNYYNGQGFLNVTLIPSRLTWLNTIGSSVTSRGQGRDLDLPTNRDQRNSYSTSLDYDVISNSKDTLSAQITYSQFEFREANQNGSDRVLFNLDWDHAVSKVTNAGAGCNTENVEFDVGQSYDAFECVVHAGRRISNGGLNLEVGQRTIEPDGDIESVDGLVYTVSLDWDSGPNRLKLQATQDLVDTSVGLFNHRFDSDQNDTLDQNTDNIDITERRRTQIDYRYRLSGVSEIKAQAFIDVDDRFRSDGNNERKGARLNYLSALTPTLNFIGEYRFLRRLNTIDSPAGRLTYTSVYTLTLEKTFSRHLLVAGNIRSEDQRSKEILDKYSLLAFGIDLFYIF